MLVSSCGNDKYDEKRNQYFNKFNSTEFRLTNSQIKAISDEFDTIEARYKVVKPDAMAANQETEILAEVKSGFSTDAQGVVLNEIVDNSVNLTFKVQVIDKTVEITIIYEGEKFVMSKSRSAFDSSLGKPFSIPLSDDVFKVVFE